MDLAYNSPCFWWYTGEGGGGGGGGGGAITFGFGENADSPVKPLPQESDFFLSIIRHCHANIFPNAGDTQTT